MNYADTHEKLRSLGYAPAPIRNGHTLPDGPWAALQVDYGLLDYEGKRAAVAHGGAARARQKMPRHREHTTRVYRRSRWTGHRGETRLSRFGSL
jgi:hypothetical protein